ncbi:hypothetical protein [Acinetobacter baumannii]|uniref:hypothetical protein n=1 Tax=Acinetobacter baumannii TaxID=470 RepID=UPI003A980D8F
MNSNFKSFSHILIVEAIISIFPVLTLMLLTYFLNGEKGIEKLIDGYISATESTNLWNLLIILITGTIFWFISYFCNIKSKYILQEVSQGFLDMGINILRLGTGVLLSFSILYFFVNEFNRGLVLFILVGMCTLVESTFFLG